MFKFIFSIITVSFMVSGCTFIPDSWLGETSRDQMMDSVSRSYTIMPPPPATTYEGSETVYQRNYILNKRMLARVGEPVLRIQAFSKQNYVTGKFILETPVVLKTKFETIKMAAREYQVMGMFELDGEAYFVLPPNNNLYVLVDMSGYIQPRFLYRIRNSDKVSLFEDRARINPARAHMKRIVDTVENKTPFIDTEIIYDGIKNNQITLFFKRAVPGTGGDQGSFETLAYPADATMISVDGTMLRIIRADKEKLEFIVLKDAVR